MKRYFILSILAVCISTAYAQESANTFNNSTSEEKKDVTLDIEPEVEFNVSPFENNFIPAPQVRSLDNILWKKTVWRMIDMREQVNYPLYYPLKESNGRVNLFLTIFNLLNEGKINAYVYNEDKEDFSEEAKLSIEEVLEKAQVQIYEPNNDPEDERQYIIDEVDIPSEQVLKFYLKEIWYFDALESTMKFKIECIAPQIYYTDDDGIDQKSVMFWVPFDELRPWLARQAVVINNKNSTSFISYDDLFQKRRFVGHIYKEDNIQNRALIEYCNTPEEVRSEQERIENEIRNFELDLWEY